MRKAAAFLLSLSFLSFNAAFVVLRSNRSPSLTGKMKRRKVADVSDALPEPLPTWVRDWKDCLSREEEENILEGPPFAVHLGNDTPLWVQFCATTWPPSCNGATVVQPATGYWSPRGGADNICSDEERYTDSCDFVVSGDGAEADLLLICTEELAWKYRLQPNEILS
jgi:hypothetical protein